MNFFGHAMVASWRRAEPGYVLGSMLPDLATMCGAKLTSVADGPVADGVDIHHETDRVFHRLPAFLALQRDTARQLAGLGVARGSALAVAHVGVELVLDGVLTEDAAAADAYLGAIESASPSVEAVRWRRTDEAGRVRGLCQRLAAHGVPVSYRDPEIVGERLERILAPRPRLALSERDAGVVRAALPAIAGRVQRRADEIVAALRDALS